MSAWTNGTYTHKGLALLSKLTQGSSLKITKAVAGTGYVTPENLAKQTSVSGLNYRLSFMSASYPATGTCKLPVVLTNENLTTGYYAKQIGLFANDPDEGEILYFIVQSAKGTEVPAEAETPGYSATWNFYFQYGQADNVNVTVDPSHIVTTDMLNEVRSIAESGVSTAKQERMITFTNAASLPFAGLKLFGKSTQNGTPAPATPVAIESIENPIVRVCKKNLLQLSDNTKTDRGLTQTVSGGVCVVSGTASSAAAFNLTLAGSYYSTEPIFTLIPGTYTVHNCMIVNNSTGKKYQDTTFTIVEPFNVTWVATRSYGADEVVNETTHPILCVGIDATPWEAYSGQIIEINRTLPGIPVSSGGNYTDENGQQWICDEIDFARGVYVQRIKRRVLDGSEAWSTNNGCVFYLSFQDMKEGGNANGAYLNNFMFNRYPNSPTWDAIATTNGVACVYWHESWDHGRIAIHEDSCSSVNEWKSYLSANNVECIYTIAEPVETSLSEAELAAYAAMTANNPVTTVMNDAGAWMVVDLVEAQHENGFRMASSGRTVESVDYPGCFYRVRNGEVEWLNPPMRSDVEYRTADRWLNYAVYTKLLYFSTLPNTATTENFIVATSGVRCVLSVDFCVVDASGGYTYANIPDVTYSVVSNMEDGSAEIAITTNSDMSKYAGYAVVRYTKQ